ncbi:MAG: dTMP kinase [Alphaproteobacteria bacterium]|nr:dTMP kinase [Alphaproteobacteria bacterium]
MTRGLFITLEGGEGSGKSTQAKRLQAALEVRGQTVTVTREPGGSPGAEAIRSLLVTGAADRWDGMTEALLLFAARRDHVERTIKPALDAGSIVICDRFTDSTMAYQGYGHDLGREPVEQLSAIVLGDFRPDLTLILDIPVEEGLKRAVSRGGDELRYEDMDVAFHHRLRDGFLDIAKRDPERCRVIDSVGTEEEVAARLQAVILPVIESFHG